MLVATSSGIPDRRPRAALARGCAVVSHGRVRAAFDALWSDVEEIGRDRETGGYHRFAWTEIDARMREWFAGAAADRGLDVTTDRAGNQWAWTDDPDAAVAKGRPGVVLGSHLDSVPDGGAFDGPLGVISALAVVDALRDAGVRLRRPLAVVNFCDEEGARFGVACAGSRILTGALAPEQALALRDADGVPMAEAITRAGLRADALGRDDETLRRIGTFVELHVEQGRALADLGRPVAVGSSIWPHGRWRVELPGRANHAGTTRLADRDDPMLALASLVQAARASAEHHDALATCAKVRITPNGVNAIPSRVAAWLDARGADEARVRAVVADIEESSSRWRATVHEESWTPATTFDRGLADHLSDLLADAPLLATGAGHDAGILAAQGIATAMLFVRNPTGVSHSPAEFAEREDCLAGVAALTAVATELCSSEVSA